MNMSPHEEQPQSTASYCYWNKWVYTDKERVCLFSVLAETEDRVCFIAHYVMIKKDNHFSQKNDVQKGKELDDSTILQL